MPIFQVKFPLILDFCSSSSPLEGDPTLCKLAHGHLCAATAAASITFVVAAAAAAAVDDRRNGATGRRRSESEGQRKAAAAAAAARGPPLPRRPPGARCSLDDDGQPRFHEMKDEVVVRESRSVSDGDARASASSSSSSSGSRRGSDVLFFLLFPCFAEDELVECIDRAVEEAV